MGTFTRAVSTLIAAGLTVAACTHDTPPGGPPPPAPDIQRVCADFVTTALSVDTATDTGPADARRRATAAFADPTMANADSGQGQDPDWPLLVEHRAHVVVSVRPATDDPPPTRADRVSASVEITRTAIGSDGWRQPLTGAVAYCGLRRAPTGWKVSELRLSSNEPGETR